MSKIYPEQLVVQKVLSLSEMRIKISYPVKVKVKVMKRQIASSESDETHFQSVSSKIAKKIEKRQILSFRQNNVKSEETTNIYRFVKKKAKKLVPSRHLVHLKNTYKITYKPFRLSQFKESLFSIAILNVFTFDF